MQKPTHHILVCASFRLKGESKGMCHKKESAALLPYIETELSDRGMEDVMVSSTGCMNSSRPSSPPLSAAGPTFCCNGRTLPVRMRLDFWLATRTNYALLTTIFKARRR